MPPKASTIETVVNVVNALLWLGAIIFLLWFVITEVIKSKDSTFLFTSSTSESYISYPSMMICPSSDSAFKVPNTTVVSVTSRLATFQENSFGSQKSSYEVCPVLTKFHTRTGVEVDCVDFQMNPTKGQGLTCDDSAKTGTWLQTPDQTPPDHPWSAVDTQSHVTIILTTQAVTSFPLIASFYTDNSFNEIPIPGDTASYESLFSIGTPQRILLPLGSTTAINMHKYVRDNYPDDRDCSYDSYGVHTQILNWSPETNFSTSSDNVDFVTVYFSYDDLISTKECHLSVMGFAEIVGIVGGGIAIVLACTILISKGVEWCLKRGQEKDDKEYSAMHN